ncbi:hypothetical protein AYI68_g4349 [Smittium mucronatum]|uniref:Uncharacterized protein n=1 Tax=Smittium mucronatum TaxID=133383 RepID=A0A1R0GXC2_9FUNG|nr:hypothetical protein AYI68_g5762 [Smittium mucronatum]OLY81543.1 hypothetical protein AYI68_g4349 [Smittium mucronatum]
MSFNQKSSRILLISQSYGKVFLETLTDPIDDSTSLSISELLSKNPREDIWIDIIDPTPKEIVDISRFLDMPKMLDTDHTFDFEGNSWNGFGDAFYFQKEGLFFELVSIHNFLPAEHPKPQITDKTSELAVNDVENSSVFSDTNKISKSDNSKPFSTNLNLTSTAFMLKGSVLVTLRPKSQLESRNNVADKYTPVNELTSKNISNILAATTYPNFNVVSVDYLLFLLLDQVVKSFEEMAIKYLEIQVEEINELVMYGLSRGKSVFYDRVLFLHQTIHHTYRNIRKKPRIFRLILKELEDRYKDKLSRYNLFLKVDEPINEDKLTVGKRPITESVQDSKGFKAQYDSLLQSSVYGTTSLVNDCKHVQAMCLHSENMLSQSYHQFQGSLLIESDFGRLSFMWYLMKWYEMYVFVSIPSVIFSIFGMNVLVPYDFNKGIEHLMAQNVHCIQFAIIVAASFILIVISYAIFRKVNTFTF